MTHKETALIREKLNAQYERDCAIKLLHRAYSMISGAGAGTLAEEILAVFEKCDLNKPVQPADLFVTVPLIPTPEMVSALMEATLNPHDGDDDAAIIVKALAAAIAAAPNQGGKDMITDEQVEAWAVDDAAANKLSPSEKRRRSAIKKLDKIAADILAETRSPMVARRPEDDEAFDGMDQDG